MNERIAQALCRLFERHRIVFWYDAKKELRDEFEALALPGIEKLELSNNEYGIKYRLLRKEPQRKFLLYREGPKPSDADNWLLDVQLAQGEFRTDQAAIWLSELELGPEFTDLVQTHLPFYQASIRREALKKLLTPDDTHTDIRVKMLAVCAGGEPRIDAVLENLLQELAGARDDKIELICRCALDGFLWQQVTRNYGYASEEPGIEDFVVELFKSCYAMGTGGQVHLTGDALVFFKRWKDSRQFQGTFEKLSDDYAGVLDIEQDLNNRDFRELIGLDHFRLIDKKIIHDLLHAVLSGTVSSDDVTQWVRQQRRSHWFDEYRNLYEAIGYAMQFMRDLEKTSLSMNSLADGIQRYRSSWYRLDQCYRKFTYHAQKSGEASLMAPLTGRVENLYANNFLLKLGDLFQSYVDQTSHWNATLVPLQKNFFEHWVQPFLRKGNKVCVIISDAMRFEIGNELQSLVRQEDRYNADLDAALSMLPSYTQLGMAALLPNRELTIVDDEIGTVQVDGTSSQGTANRGKILGRAISQRATALQAEDLKAMHRDNLRSLVRDHDLIYVYHNRIDVTGDNRISEEKVFEAVEDTLQDLILLIKKMNNANLSNMLVTTDHGFIYQNRAIEESDFSGNMPEGESILSTHRRFVFGRGLKELPGLRKFTSAQLGLSGDIEVQIPKSINRLRVKGSGSRFTHGGATLQEVVIPVLKINKKRQSDVSNVEVDILQGSSSAITSGQLAVVLYQTASVTDKIRPRVLRAGIYTEAGDLISDSHELTFDLASDNSRERELRVRFVLTREADEANGQEVILKLEEKHPGTSHYREYKTLRYMMRRSFTSDFDI